jgi:hypothetical protein
LLGAMLFSGCALGPTSASVQQPAGPALQYMGSWGVKGDDPGQLDLPSSIATDARGHVYIANAGSQYIDKFEPQGTPLLSFQDDRLKHPQSIAVDRGGAIYVTDPVRCSVFVFLPDGSRYRELRLAARPNAENTLDIAVSDDGEFSVLDVSAAKVFDFSPALRLMRSWKPGTGISVGSGRPLSIMAGPADTILVGGFAANSLLRYDDGKFTSQMTLGAAVGGDGLQAATVGSAEMPASHDADSFAVSDKYIFRGDADGRTVHVWALDGKPKTDLDLSKELGDAQRGPLSIAISPTGDLLVLDARNVRVLRYHLNL